MRRLFSPAVLVFLLIAGPAAAQDKVEFNRDIRPILSDNCFACHGPDKNQRKAELRLDDRDDGRRRRRRSSPASRTRASWSTRILADDADEVMPPPKSHKKLTADAEGDCSSGGSPRGRSTSRTGPTSRRSGPPVPAVEARGWVRNPIDAFVLAALEAKGIEPVARGRPAHAAPPAQPRPDRPAADAGGSRGVRRRHSRPDAYEKQVDRLLASPHYGERMAVPWLDLVRFADTVGYHGDQNQQRLPVPRLRHRRVQREQAVRPVHASSSSPATCCRTPTTEQRVATGFNRLNMMTREGGAQPKEYLAKYAADRVRTVGDGLARRDDRLLRVPRPQVRPVHARRTSTRWPRSSPTSSSGASTATTTTRRTRT